MPHCRNIFPSNLANKTFNLLSDKLEHTSLLALAEAGDVEAQFYLGQLYWYGDEGIPESVKKSTQWCKKAAEKGHAMAQFFLATIMEYDWKHREETFQERMKWYRKAAAQGIKEAEYELGRESTDKKEAKKWYRKAALHGHLRAFFLLMGWEEFLWRFDDWRNGREYWGWLNFLPIIAFILLSGLVWWLFSSLGIDLLSSSSTNDDDEGGGGGLMLATLAFLVPIGLAFHYFYQIKPKIDQAKRMYALNTLEADLALINFSFERLVDLSGTYYRSGCDCNYTFGLAHKFYKQKIQEGLLRLEPIIEKGDTVDLLLIIEKLRLLLNDRCKEVGFNADIERVRNLGVASLAMLASHGRCVAQYGLALCYDNWWGGLGDKKLAQEWYQKADITNNAEAMYQISRYYKRQGDLLNEEAGNNAFNYMTTYKWLLLACKGNNTSPEWKKAKQEMEGLLYEDEIGEVKKWLEPK